MRRLAQSLAQSLAPGALALLILTQAPLDGPWHALLVFPALGLVSRWSDDHSGDSHDP